jgi:hypothetical protein
MSDASDASVDDSMLDNQGRLLTKSGELFINALEITATGDRKAWVWATVCMAPFLNKAAVRKLALAVISQLNNSVQDRAIDGIATRAEYICVSMGRCGTTYHTLDKILHERTAALSELMRTVRMDLGDSIKMSIEIPLRKEEAVCMVARECAKMLSRPYVSSSDVTAYVPPCTWVSEVLSHVCSIAFKFGGVCANGYTTAQGCQLV